MKIKFNKQDKYHKEDEEDATITSEFSLISFIAEWIGSLQIWERGAIGNGENYSVRSS